MKLNVGHIKLGRIASAFISCLYETCAYVTPCSEEGKEYEFRVFSENEIGESEPLQTARPFLAKNQYSKSYVKYQGCLQCF